MKYIKICPVGLLILFNLYSAVYMCNNGTYEVMFSTEDDSFRNTATSYDIDYNVTFAAPESNVTICLWISPNRFSYLQTIMSFENLSIILQNGFIGIDLNSQIHTFSSNVSLWQWTQFCILISPNISLYLDGVSYTSDVSYTIPSKDPATYSVTIGEDSPQISQPFPGRVAALYIYSCSLPENELQLVASGSTSSYCGSYQIRPDQPATDSSIGGIKLSNICSNELLKQTTDTAPLIFSDWQNYAAAVAICKKFGGSIPFINETDLATIISDFVKTTGKKLQSFWLQSSVRNNICEKGVIKFGEITVQNVSCNSTQLPVFCIQNKTFRLLGFPWRDNVFYPVPYNPFVYESRKSKFRLSFSSENSKITLKSIESGDEFGQITNAYETDVVGRRTWLTIPGSEKMIMAFTCCAQDQFTCNNGECIDIAKACNFESDCPILGFDEAVCSPGMTIDNSYQNLLAPMVNDQQLAQIGINITLENFVELDLSKGILTLTVTVMAKWRDYRLKFKYLRELERPMEKNTTKMYWHPNIKIDKAKSEDKDKFNFIENLGEVTAKTIQNGTFQYVNDYEALVLGGKDVDIIHQKTEDLSIHCPIKMFLFPFDKQECIFSMELQNVLKTDAEINRNLSKAIIANTFSVTIYKNLKFDMTFDDDNKQKAVVTFSVSREFGAFIFNIFLPCILLEIIGLLTNFLPTEDYADRVAIAMSVLFVMAAMFTMISSSLPATAQPKLIDVWMFAHTALLILIFVFQILVIYLHFKKKVIREEEEEEKTKMEKLFVKTVLRLKTPVVEPEKGTSSQLGWMDYLTDGTLIESKADERANIIGFVVCTAVYIIFLTAFVLSIFFVK